MKVKICGITNTDDAQVAVKYGADALGFIFYEKSQRYIEPEDAKKIIDQLPFFILKIGVFVNESSTLVNDIAKQIGLNAVQLHGEESPAEVNEITLPVVKAFRVAEEFNYKTLDEYEDCTFLLDAFDSSEYGGTGKTFRWELIPEKYRSKIILAGGISVDNVGYVAERIKPQAIDVSSSIEDSPGKKNHKKLIELLNRVKASGNL